MDYKNQPIITPDSRQVSDNRMRCLVKNMAMFGLGISLYMKFSDDLPDEDKDRVSKKHKEESVKAKKPEVAEAVVEEGKMFLVRKFLHRTKIVELSMMKIGRRFLLKELIRLCLPFMPNQATVD